ncbi:MAG: mechanosensitive ion channel family protein [Candidatus Baltobacteraceae bacterium]
MFCAFVFAASSAPAYAQIVPSLPKASPGTAGILGLRRDGLFLTAPLTVDGAPVLRIAVPATPSAGGLPIDVRLLYIQNAISQILAQKDGSNNPGTVYDPHTFKIAVDRVGHQETLVATDGTHPDEIPILTITSADAQYAHVSAETLAQEWRPLLQSALVAALEKRQPAEIRSNLERLRRAAAILAVATLFGIAIWMLLRGRGNELKRALDARKEQAESSGADTQTVAANPTRERRRLLAIALLAAGPDQELQRVRALCGLVQWVLAAAWASTITWALLLFPQTTGLGQSIVRVSINVAFIWVGAGLLNKILDLVIDRFAQAYAHRGLSNETRARHLLRAPTISRSLGEFKGFIIVFIAMLATLSALGIPIASVVTIGGIAALAIGFAAQSLVRDVLNGFLVLIEDQYVVGDYVMIGDYNGVVENLTLRVVQIRDGRGNLVTIPHSAVSQVVNASRAWSRIDFRIPIDARADLNKAISTLRSVLEALGKDRAWKSAILEPVEWIGVETPSKNGVVLRAAIRTEPLRQFDVGRAITQRVCEAFEREGIALGVDPLGVPVPSVTASPQP